MHMDYVYCVAGGREGMIRQRYPTYCAMNRKVKLSVTWRSLRPLPICSAYIDQIPVGYGPNRRQNQKASHLGSMREEQVARRLY